MTNTTPTSKTESERLEAQCLPPVSPAERRRLLTELLSGVSRAFYLTLRILPEEVREPVGLAYLLARAADTIADTRLLPAAQRLRHLLAFRAQIEGPASFPALQEIENALTGAQAIPAERALLQALPALFSLLEAMLEQDRKQVRAIVVTLTRGMEQDLNTFPAEDSGKIGALKTPAELDRYIYYVAGCVGEFWTAIIVAHIPSLRNWDVVKLSESGVRFGKALQLTNVLRDVPKDLRMGRCYLPEAELTGVKLEPARLLDPAAGPQARPVLIARLRTALEHYQAAEEYLLATPRRCLRLRLAVLWPILIGLATLAKLVRNPAWLDPAQPSKVTRAWVYRMLALSIPCVCSNALLKAWIAALRHRVEEAY